MTDLTDFGAGSNIGPPLVRRMMCVQSPHTGKLAGFICRDRSRDCTSYTTLRRGPHFYRNKQAYAISDSILDRLVDADVARIYVHEGTDDVDEDVYEFTTRQYVEEGKPVPDSDLHDDGPEWDPQTYVTLDEYVHKWPGHSSGLFVQTFSRAVENMNPPWRGYDPDLKERIENRKEERRA